MFYLVARNFRGDQLQLSYQLLYHMMSLFKSCTERSFEIIIDLTQSTQHNEPDVSIIVVWACEFLFYFFV